MRLPVLHYLIDAILGKLHENDVEPMLVRVKAEMEVEGD